MNIWATKRLQNNYREEKLLCQNYAIHYILMVSQVLHVREFKIKIVLGCIPLGCSGSESLIRDHSDHGRSNEPVNPCSE